MIYISIFGLDQFVVGDLSQEITPLIAKLYEVNEDDVNFISTNNMVFHNGVEQTSWRAIIEVKAPEELERLQENAKEILFHFVSQVAIHVEVVFSYYCHHDRFVKLNPEYPNYMEDSNLVNAEEEYHEDMEEGEEDDQIFTGDIFENIEEKMKHSHDDEEECHDEHCHHHHH